MTRAELDAAALVALDAARTGDVAESAGKLERLAPRFTWRTPGDRWAFVDTARAIRRAVEDAAA